MKNPCRYFVPLFLFCLQLEATAQKNRSTIKDSISRKYADTSQFNYRNSSLYYICSWENEALPAAKIIRKLDDQLAIVAITNQAAFDSLKGQVTISAANDNWKLSPPLEALTLTRRSEQKYTLSGTDSEELVTV